MQGGVTRDLRDESAEALKGIGFEGYAVGGLAVGEGQEAMFAMLDHAPGMLPANRPRYLMGVGKPDDIVGAVARGVDMMDCVLPTRSGRTGQAFTRGGVVNLRNARHRGDEAPLDAECACPACRGYSRAYLHHVVRAGEMIAGHEMDVDVRRDAIPAELRTKPTGIDALGHEQRDLSIVTLGNEPIHDACVLCDHPLVALAVLLLNGLEPNLERPL